jgi:hypothetical protein
LFIFEFYIMATTFRTNQIEVRQTNLYSNGFIVDFPDDGESVLLRDKVSFNKSEDDEYYVVKDGDRIELIAYKKYQAKIERAAELWWVIADANNIFNPFDLTDYVGKELRIPNIYKLLLSQ